VTTTAFPPPRTLRDLIARVQVDNGLTPRQRADMASAVRRFVTATGCSLEAGASFQVLRPALEGAGPPNGPVRKASAKSWANVRCGLQAALRRYACRPNLPKQVMTPWNALRQKLPKDKQRIGLSRFFNWASSSGISPEDVSDQVLNRFDVFINNSTLVRKPFQIHRRTAVLWNSAKSAIHGWPGSMLTVPSYRKTFALPEESFPASLIADFDAWEKCVSGKDPLNDKAPIRPLREATWRHDRGNFVRAASALVHKGLNINAITSLSVIVQPHNVKAILEFYISRLGQKTRGTSEIANALYAVAKKWVRAPESSLLELVRLRNLVTPKTRGMSQKSKNRLHQFGSEESRATLVRLPVKLVRAAEQTANPTKAALLIQSAVMIEILLLAPMRLGNLVNLNLKQHFIFPAGRVGKIVLSVSQEEVKNDHALQFELPDQASALLRRYLKSARTLFINGADEGWLFPGQKGGRKHEVSVGGQISGTVRKHTGLKVSPHLFRHFAAKIYLEAHPTDYETVRQLLGHKSIQTTISFYCELDTARALKRFDNIVLGLRNKKAA
jgi:integrase